MDRVRRGVADAVREAGRPGTRWVIGLLIAAALGLWLWSAVETTREPRSLSLQLSLPSWFAILLVVLGVFWWAKRRRVGHSDRAMRNPAGVGGPGEPAAEGRAIDDPEPERRVSAERLLVRVGRTTHLVDIARIRWIGAEGKYARVCLADRTLLTQYSIGEIGDRLPSDRFARVHRSRIVNLQYVRGLRMRGRRDAEALLDDGTPIPVSRRYRAELERLLKVAL